MKLVMNTSCLMRLEPREVAAALSLSPSLSYMDTCWASSLSFPLVWPTGLPVSLFQLLRLSAFFITSLLHSIFGIIVDQLCCLSVSLIIHSFTSFFSHAVFRICFEKHNLIIHLVDSYLWVLIYEIL